MLKPPSAARVPSRFTRGPLAATVALAVFLTVFLAYRLRSAAAPLPVDRLLVSTGWADETRCSECHHQGKTFWETGHAQTLQRADGPASRALLATLADTPACVAEGTTVAPAKDGYAAVNQFEGFRSKAKLDWCFGSGRHARTWVATLPDSHGATDLMEFRWTWYHSIDGFDFTPAQTDKPLPGYFARLGILFDQPKARRCFGCHASYVPIDDGEILSRHIQAGVTCQRCHGPRAEHVASGGEILSPSWTPSDQMESVHRCAECHRRADELDPATITPQNPDIVRFQPVGLVQSACFQKSKMTCTTCHDPHRTLEAQNSTGLWQCLQCHDGTRPDRPHCRAGQTDDCLRCHLPKVSMQAPLKFSDHWIRIRDDESPP